MRARQRMTMRATIERNMAVMEDNYGQPGPPDWQVLTENVACYVWAGGTGIGGGRMTDSANERTVVVDGPGAIFPTGTDIKDADRLSTVTDRRGVELFGMLYVDGTLYRRDHLAVGLREYA